MSILDTPSGRIQPNWTIERDKDARAPAGYSFAIVAPYNDGLPGQASLGFFAYGPHAELAAKAPAMAAALEKIAAFKRGGLIKMGTPEHDRDEMIGIARETLRTAGK